LEKYEILKKWPKRTLTVIIIIDSIQIKFKSEFLMVIHFHGYTSFDQFRPMDEKAPEREGEESCLNVLFPQKSSRRAK
jgi:hypothetical protein